MKSGIYALLNLDGSPLGRGECDCLDLAPDALADEQGCAFAARDVEGNGAAVSRVRLGGKTVILLGELTEPGMTSRLGLPAQSEPAELAYRAWCQHGPDLALHLDGEWSLLQWDPSNRELIVSMSWASRDPIHFAETDRQVALAPGMAQLLRLPWVSTAFDLRGMCLHFAQAGLRADLSQETPLEAIRRVPPGGTEIFGARRASLVCGDPLLPPIWEGSFDEALAAFDALLLQNLRRGMKGHRQVGIMLSGGLDSSTLALYAHRATPPDSTLTCYTSAAPRGSGLDDEAAYARMVTDALGLQLVPVVPPPEASVYIPTDSTFDHNEIPVASPRHYLYEAFYSRALGDGAKLLLDGSYGEGTVTYWPHRPRKVPLWRKVAKSVLQPFRARPGEAWVPFADQFHPRLAAPLLEELERSALLGPVRSRPGKGSQLQPMGEQFGYLPAMRKNAMTPTASPAPGLRHIYPFRERSLVRLMASMPTRLIDQFGGDRLIARRLIAGHLPDAIVNRRKSGEFSPDFFHRFSTGSERVLDLLPHWRRSAGGDWLDLSWLERQLIRLRTGERLDLRQLYRIQTTSVGAAYFDWISGKIRGRDARAP